MIKKDELFNEQKQNAKIERTSLLNKVKTLKGYKLDSLDGEIGKVKEFYFDDKYWTIRYMVADTGNWLSGRQVLISPYALRAVNKEEQNIAINLTKKQIEDSPSLDSDKPVSRQFEEYTMDIMAGPCTGTVHTCGDLILIPYSVRDRETRKEFQAQKKWDPHLRSTNAVRGYHVQASDGGIGNVEDFIIDEETWAIRYLIINTRNYGREKWSLFGLDGSRTLVGAS